MRVTWSPPPTVELGALRRIPKVLVDLDDVRSDLTVRNPAWWKARMHGLPTQGIPPTLVLYQEDRSSVLVPRHYEVPYRGGKKPVEKRLVANGQDGERSWYVEHSIELRDRVQEEASLALREGGEDKIISLACGKGKTVTSLHAAAEGDRFPMLIVVHTNALMDQWRASYGENGELRGGLEYFYNLDPALIGHVQGPIRNWKHKPVTIAMLHSLVLKQYPQEFYDYFKLIVFDEVHKLGAQMFLRAASLFRGERWGLSATVAREDGMDKVFQLHLGKVVYKDLKQALKPKCYFIDTGVSASLNGYMMRGGRVNMSKLQTMLSEHDERNDLIIGRLKQACDQGRTILVLGERLAQLYEFSSRLKSEGYDAALHVGSMSSEERREALKHQVVLASTQLAREGLDRPAFDTEFLLTAHGGAGRIQQETGRILRVEDAKKTPKVLIFEDRISIMKALANRMRKAFQSMGFEQHNVHFMDRKEAEVK